MSTGARLPLLLLGAAGVLYATAVAGAIAGWEARPALALAGLGLLLVGGALVVRSHAVAPADADEEERVQKGPGAATRRHLLRGGIGVTAVALGGLAVPAWRRVERATDELRSTAWTDGIRAVDERGEPVRASEVGEGEVITIYPEGAVGDVSSQAVLIREAPERFVADAERPGWVAEGLVAYSKLCTHMACPLGLYQQQSATLLCPCHQAAFDVLDGGRALAGPARRALPQLPLRVVGDDVVAAGDFSDAVGTGFWGRP